MHLHHIVVYLNSCSGLGWEGTIAMMLVPDVGVTVLGLDQVILFKVARSETTSLLDGHHVNVPPGVMLDRGQSVIDLAIVAHLYMRVFLLGPGQDASSLGVEALSDAPDPICQSKVRVARLKVLLQQLDLLFGQGIDGLLSVTWVDQGLAKKLVALVVEKRSWRMKKDAMKLETLVLFGLVAVPEVGSQGVLEAKGDGIGFSWSGDIDRVEGEASTAKVLMVLLHSKEFPGQELALVNHISTSLQRLSRSSKF